MIPHPSGPNADVNLTQRYAAGLHLAWVKPGQGAVAGASALPRGDDAGPAAEADHTGVEGAKTSMEPSTSRTSKWGNDRGGTGS